MTYSAMASGSDHVEAASKPLSSWPEPQPRGAKVHDNRPIDQAEAAAGFIAALEHEKMLDERLRDLRKKRDREMHGILSDHGANGVRSLSVLPIAREAGKPDYLKANWSSDRD